MIGASAAIGAGSIAAIINNLLAEWRDRRKETLTTTRDAVYLAARVAVTLERFAIDCVKIFVTIICSLNRRIMRALNTCGFHAARSGHWVFGRGHHNLNSNQEGPDGNQLPAFGTHSGGSVRSKDARGFVVGDGAEYALGAR